jgi:hypothetical protein
MCRFAVSGDRILPVTQSRLDLSCFEDVAILGGGIHDSGGDRRLHSSQSSLPNQVHSYLATKVRMGFSFW